jgi:hypothetical protein
MNGSSETLGTEREDSSDALIRALDALREAVLALQETMHAQVATMSVASLASTTDQTPSTPTAAISTTTGAIAALTEADQWLVDLVLKNPETKLARLFRGDWQALGYKERAHAEMALLAKLAWTTKGDAAQMARLFRASQLMGPRFDQEGTDMIEKAIEFMRERAPERFDDE